MIAIGMALSEIQSPLPDVFADRVNLVRFGVVDRSFRIKKRTGRTPNRCASGISGNMDWFISGFVTLGISPELGGPWKCE